MFRMPPPVDPIGGSVVALALRPHQSPNDLEAVRVLLRTFQWPVAEVNDPAAGRAVRPRVEILAVDVREYNLAVPGGMVDEPLGVRRG